MTITACEIDKVAFEHYASPLGINTPSPRISWTIARGAKEWYQSDYEIEVRTAGETGHAEIHSVKSDNSILVPWPSTPLASRQRALVRVRARSTDGDWTAWRETEVEAGLLDNQEWKSSFVACSPPPTQSDSKRPFRLRQIFTIPLGQGTGKPPQARLYVTALGVYEAYMNGVRVGDDILAPGWTSYNSRLAYQTHDVTHLLREGRNVIGAWVGEGWYAGNLGYNGGSRNIFGERPALLAQLEIDGKAIQTEWEYSFGAVVSSEIYNGEVYDSRLPDNDDLDVGEWSPVESFPIPDVKLFSSQSPPIRAVQVVRPVKIITTPGGNTVVDFGQNLGGVIRLLAEPSSTSEQRLVIRHAEVLEHGELGTRPLRYAKATDTIHLGGARGVKGYMPKFTFHGFRYAEVTGWPGITLDDLEAIVFQSSMRRTGHFHCSHPLINRLHENALWSTIGNTIGLPTDCPQRDERLGWTGDVCVFSPTMSYLFDTSGFLSEWLQDLWHDQRKLDGVVPIFIPDTGTDVSTPEAIWGDAAVVVPHDVYLAYGDTAVLERQFQSIRMWLDHGVKRDSITGMWSRDRDQLGDWLAPRAPPETPNMGPTDNMLVADAWLIHSTRTAAKIARVIGKQTESSMYTHQASRLTEAFYNEYVTASGRLVSETQTAVCLLLHFEIYPESCKSGVDYRSVFAERLSELVVKANWLIDTGFAGTPIVLPTLADHGHSSHAYRMLQATQCPSWLSCVLLDATTIWERWDSMLADGSINPGEMTSFNHYALGSVASFMHKHIGGLSPLSPGWKDILVQPQPGGTVTAASTSHISPYGMIEVEWEIQDEQLQVVVEVPPNCTAQIVLPGKKATAGSGRHQYTVPYLLPQFPPAVLVPHFAPIRPNDYAA